MPKYKLSADGISYVKSNYYHSCLNSMLKELVRKFEKTQDSNLLTEVMF